MPRRPQALRAAFLAAAAALGFASKATAIDLTWSADGFLPGGSGTWDLESTTWIDELLGGGSAVWDIEEFGGATFTGDPLDPEYVPATVTLGASLSATTLTFAVDGFTLAASSNPIHTLSLGSGITADGDAAISARLAFTGAQTWSVAAGKTLTLSGPLANAGNLLSLAGEGNTVISGSLSGTGGLSKGGTGSLTLSGANTFSGATTLSAGTLVLANAAALAGSTLDLAAGGTGTLSFAGTGTYQLGGLEGARNLALGDSSIAVGANNASTTYSGILSGTGGLAKSGTGTLTLSGANTFTGKVAITGGAIAVAAESGLGAAPAVATADALTLDGGALILTAGNQTFSANRGITLGAGGGTLDTSSIADSSGNSVTFAGAISGTGNLTVKAHGDLGAGGGGSNTLVRLSGANTFTGTVTVSDGLVTADSGFGAAANTLRFANGGGLLHTSGTSTFTRAIEVTSTGGIVRLYGSTTFNLAGTLTGSGTLSRTDSGTLNLTGDLTGFTGTFANLAGTTVIDTLGVSGLGGVTLAGGSVLVRHNPGALGSAAITVTGNSTLGSNGTAGVRVGNAIAISGTSVLTLAGSAAAPYVQTGAVTGASSVLLLGTAATLAAGGSSGSILTIGESSGAILAHGFSGTYGTVRFAPINIGTQGVGMMIGGSLTATSQGQDNRDAQFAFLQAGGSATFGRLATGQTESGSNEGGEGGISIYALQGGTLSLGSTLTGSGGGWADRGLHLYATGGTMRATANGNWTPFMHVSAAGTGGATLDTNGFNATFTRNLAGTGVLNLTGAAGSVILNNLTSVTNSFAGSGALSKSNTSTTVFSGDFANYTGTFTLSGGTAQFSSASDTTFAGSIAGSGILSKAGSGTLRLTGANTWSSNAAITAGALSLASTAALPGWNTAGRWSVASGATLAVGNAVTDAQFETLRGLSANFAAGSFIGFDTLAGNRAYAGSLAGAVGIAKVGANTLFLSSASAFTGPIGAFGGTLDLSGSTLASAGAITVAGGSLVNGRLTTSTAVAGQSGFIGASLAGTGGVAKTTSGVLALAGFNTYTAATTVSAGTLVVESLDSLPRWDQAGGFSVASGAGLAVGNAVSSAQLATLLATGNFAAGSRVGFDTTAGNRTHSTVLANTAAGALGLVKTGAGTLTVAGANTFTGSVLVAGGTLAFSTLADSGSSNLGIGTALALEGGGTLRFTGITGTSTVRTLAVGQGGGVIQVDLGGTLTLGPNVASASAAWSGSGGVTKTGAGTLVVGNNHASSTNRFNVGSDTGGNFTMAEGVLSISPTQFLTFGDNSQDVTFLQTGGTVNTTLANGSYIGNGTGGPYSASLIITGGTFNQSQDWMRVGQNGYSRGFLTIGGGAGPAVANVNQVQLGSSSRYSSGTLTLLAGGTLVANTVNRGNGAAIAIFDGGTLRANSNTSNLLTGVATVIRSGGAILDDGGFTVTIAQGLNADGVGSGGVTKLGAGTLRLVGTNTYAGNTLVDAGTLAVGSIAALPGWDVAGRWTAAAGTILAVGNTFTAAQVASLVATGNFTAGSALGFDTADGSRIFAGAVADGANGPLAVTKIGANTLTLSGSSTYTGLTTVANGTLELASRTALADATNLQVRSAATLMFEVAGAGNFTNADLGALLPSLYETSALTGLRAGSFLGFDTAPGSFILETALGNSTGANGGAVGLVKIGANTLTLTGANTYGGATTVSAGTLALASGASITGGGAFSLAGGTLALASGASITSSGNLTISGGSFLDLGGGTSTFGAVTVSALASSGSVIRNGTLAASSLTFTHTSGTDVLGANLALGGVLSMATAGSVEFASGTHSLSHFYLDNGGRVTVSGGTVVATGDRTDLRTGTLAITGGHLTLAGLLGSNASGKTTVINQSGGTVTVTGTTNNVTTGASFLLNHWGSGSSNSTYNLSGGTLNVHGTHVLLNWDGTGTFNQSGGTANLLGIDFNTGRNTAATVNLTGGRLNLGLGGIIANNNTETFTAGAATLGALADWSTVKTLTLTDAAAGLVIDTTDVLTGAGRAITLSGALSGTGRLTVSGTGMVNLNAANTNTGLVTVSGGALRLSNATSLAGGIGATGGTGALSVNGGVIDLAAGDFSRALGTGAGQVAFAGSGGFAATGAARTVNLGGAAAQVAWGSGSFIPNGGELLLGHALANNTVTFANALALGASDRTVRVARGLGNLDGILSGAITGDGGLIKAGEGILSLTGANTYAGNTAITSGVLAVAGTGSLSGWDTAGRWSVAAGAALAAGNAVTDADLATLLATGNLAAGAALGFDTSAGDRTYAGALADTAAGSLGLAKVGANTLVLSGANAHSGPTTLFAGTTRLARADALATSTLVLSGGALAFDSALAGNTFTLGGLAGSTGLVLQDNAATPAAVTLAVGANNANTTFSGSLSGPGSLTKVGTGTLTLSGAGHSHAGVTTVAEGTLILQTGLTGTLVAESGTTILVQHAAGLAGLYSANGGGGAVADLVSLATLDTKMLGTAVTVAQSSAARGANFDFASNGSGFPAPYNAGASSFVGRWTGQFYAETAGTYTFFTSSDDGSKIWINGQEVVNNNFAQAVTERSGTITLEAGWHDITAGFYNGTGGYGLFASFIAPGQAKAALPNALLRSAPVVGNLATAAGSTLDLGSVGLVVNQSSDTLNAGALVGSGSLTKVGNGTLTLGDVDGFTGDLAVHAGRLIVTGDLALGGRSLAVGPAADSNRSLGLTLAGVVSGTSGLTKSGNGVLALTNAANTFSGGITNLTGVLAASSDGALGDAANHIVLGNGAIFRAIGTFSTGRTLDLAGANTTAVIQVTAGNTLVFSGTLADATPTTQLVKADHGTLALGAILSPGWSGALNQLFDPTSLTGGVRVDAGVLRIDDSSALAASNVVVVNNYQGAAVELADGVNLAATFVGNILTGNAQQGLYSGLGLGNLFVASGEGTLSGDYNLRQDSGVGAAAGATLNLAGNLRFNARILSVLGAGTVHLSGTSVNALHSLYKLGSGNLNLTTALSAFTSGGLVLFGGGGTTTLSGAGAFAAGWTTGGINVRGGDTLVVDNSAANLANRLGGAAAFVGRDATLRLVNSATSANRETLGLLTASHGYTRIVVETTAQDSLLSFGALNNNIPNGGGTLVFEAAGTGANFGTAANTVRFRDSLPGSVTASPGRTFIWRTFVVDGLGTNFAQYSDGSVRAFQGYDTAGINALSAPGVSPTAAWTPTLQVDASSTLGAHRTVNALRLTGADLVLGGSGAALTLHSGGLLATGGTSTLAAGSFIQGGATEIWIGVADGSTLNLEGALSTSSVITKALGGTLNLAAPIYSTANWYILNGGTTNLLADNVLYSGQGVTSGTQNLSLSYGATLDLRGTSQMVGILGAPTNNQYAGVAGLLTNTSETKALFVTHSSGGSGDLFPGVRITGNMAVVHGGNRTRYLYSDNTHTGRTAILSNAFLLIDEGRLSGTSGIDVNYGGRLYFRNTGTRDLADRLNDAATVTLRGGGLEFNGRAQTASSETVGSLVLAQGWNSLLVNSGGIGLFSADLVLGTLSATGGVMNIDGINSQPGSASRLRVQDNAVGAINGIVPYAVYSRELVGYVPDQGFSFIGAAGFPAYGATALASGLNPTLNVRTTSTSSQTLTANTSVNALLWNYGASSPTLTLGSNTLSLTAGVLALASGNDSRTFTLTGGFLQSGTADFYIHKLNYNGTARRATISSVIQDGTAGATRLIVSSFDAAGSSNYLTLTAANTYTGGTVINGGQVQLGGGVGTVVLPAGGITLNGGMLTLVTNGGQIAAANTVTLNGPASLVLAGANTLEQLVFNNTGGTATPGVSGGTLNLTSATAIVASGYNPSTIATVSSTLDFGGAAKTLTVNPLAYDGRDFAPLLPTLHLSGIVQSSGTLTVNGGGVLQVSGASTFSGGYSVAAGTGLAIGASSTGAVTSGPLGTGALTLASGARLQSTGAFSVANAVSVNGELRFEGVNSLTLSGGVSLAANATFDIQAPQPTLTLSGVVAGSGRSLAKTGYGTLALTGANTFDGGVTVSRGTLSLGNAAALGSGTLTLSGGALDSSVANLTLSTNTAQAWNGAFNFTGTQNLNLGTGAVTLGADVMVGVSANTLTVGGAIGDAGANRGLTKVGNGILRLTGVNTYGGTTSVDAGVLLVNATAALPGWDTAGRVAVRNGGALALGLAVSDADIATLLATGAFASGGALGFDVSTGNRTWSSALTGTMGLAVLDTDAAAVNTLTVSGDNNFSGGTTVYSGSLILAHQNALRGSVLTLRGGSVVFSSAVAGNAFSIGGLSGSANLALQNNAGTPAAVALTVGSANTDTVYTGVLSGAGSLTKVGTGTLTLAGGNSFTGNVLVSGGTLRSASGSAFGAGNTANTKVTVAAGAAVDIMGSALVHGFTIAGTGVGGTGAITNTGAPVGPGSAQISNIRLSANASIGGSMNWALLSSAYAANSLDLAGFTLTKTGVNTIGLATTTATAGQIQVDAGFINFGGGSGGSGVTAASTSIVLSNISGAGLIVSRDSSIGSLAGGGASGGNLALNGGTLTVGGLNTNTAFAGAISGGGNLTKTGTGTLTLSGGASHTGATTLSAGSILLASSGALGSTTLSLNAGSLGFAAGLGSASLGALGGSANLALQDAAGTPAAVALTVGANNGTTTYSGILSGAGSLTKVGNGNLTLTGANSFSGGVAVAAGTLTLGSGAALPGLAVAGRNSVASGATLSLANGVSDADLAGIASATNWSSGSFLGLDTSAGNRAHAAALSGDFALAKIGANTLTLSGANSFSGGLAVRSGIAVATDLGALPGHDIVGRNAVSAGATLALGNAVSEADFLVVAAATNVASGGFVGLDTSLGDRILAGVLAGDKGFAKTGANTLTLAAGGTLAGPLNVAGGTLLLAGSNTLGGGAYAGAITLASGATFTVATSANQTLSGGFAGAGTLAKSGLGTLTLAHASNSPAAINLTEGVLALGSANAAQWALIDVGSAGAQRLEFAVAGTNTYTVGGLQGTDAVDLGANSLQIGGNNLSSTFSGVLSGSGALTKIGTGTVVLAGAESNTYTGLTTLVGGPTSYLGLAKTGGAVAIAGDITLSAAATRAILYTLANNQFGPTSVLRLGNANDNRFELRGTTQTLAGLEGTGTAAFIQHSEFTPGSNLSAISNLNLNVTGNHTFTSWIRNQGGTLTLAKLGAGTQTLTGTSINITYTGPTSVLGGTLVLNDTRGFASAAYVGAGATLRVASQSTFGNRTSQANLTNLISGPGTFTVAGATSGVGGSWLLLNAATRGLYNFTGTVNVTSGVLSMDNITGAFSGNPDLNLSSGGLFAIRSQTIYVNALTGAGTVFNSNTSDANGRTLGVGLAGGSGTFTGAVAGSVATGGTDGALEQGLTGISKFGSGTQVLAPTATYTATGGFGAFGGVLELDYTSLANSTNLLAATAPVTLGSGTLRLKGKSSGATTQTLGGVTLAAGTGGSLLVNPNGGTSTTVTLGAISLNAGSSLLVGTAPSAGAGTVTLSTSSAAVAGILNRLVFTNGTTFDWAALSGTSIVGFSGYSALATAAGTDTNNSRITASATLGGSVTTNSLKIEGPAAGQSLDLGAGNTLTLTGGGLLVTGDQAFSLANGTLAAGNGIGAYELAINQHATGELTIGSVIANNAGNATALTKAGSGALVLTGANTYTGATHVVGGTLRAVGASSLGSGAVTLGGGTLHLDADTGLTGSRAVTVSADSTLVLGRATDGAGLTSTFGALTFNDAFTLTVQKDANVTSGTAVANFTGFPQFGAKVTSNNISSYKMPTINVGVDVEVLLSGNANSAPGVYHLLRKQGAGTLALSGSNTWWDPLNGYVRLDGGTLDLRHHQALGDGGTGANSIAVFMAGGTTLRFSADTGTSNNADITLQGTGATLVANRATAGAGVTNVLDVFRSEGAFTLNVTGGSNVTSGSARFNFSAGQILGDTTLNIVNPAAGETVLALGATNQLGGTFQVTKTGSGTLLLTGANTFTGLTLREGVTELSASGAQGYAGDIVMAGGTLRFSAANTSDISARLAFRSHAIATFDTNGQNVTFASSLGGGSAAGLTKAGNGVLTLAAASTYLGNTTVQAGVLSVATTAALPGWNTLGRWSVASGAGLAVGNGVTDAEFLALLAGTGLASGASIGFDTSAGNRTFDGALAASGSGTVGLIKVGANTLTLTGSSTYAGATTVSAGTLALSGSGALGAATALNLAVSGAVFDISGLAASSSAVGSLAGVAGSVLSLGSRNLVVGDAASTTFSGVINDTGSLGSLAKVGAGTLTLAGANTFAGGLLVASGTLASTNATGFGAVAGAVTLAPGDDAAALLLGYGVIANHNIGVSGSGSGLAVIGGVTNAASGSNTQYGGVITLARDLVLRAGSADRLTIAGRITGTGNLTIATPATAGGRITFNQSAAASANDFTGDIIIQNGAQLQVGVASNTNNFAIPDTASVHFDAQSNANVVNLRISGSGTGAAEAINALVSNAPGAGLVQLTEGTSGVLTIGAANGGGNFSGVIAGALSLVKSGSGTQVLSGINTFTGNITVSDGTLSIANGGRVYSGGHRTSVVTVNSGGVLELERWGYNTGGESLGGLQAQASSIVVNGGTIRIIGTTPTSYHRGVTIQSGGATLEAAAGADWTLASDTAFVLSGNPSLTLAGAGIGTLAKAFSGSGSLVKTGAGTWTYSGAASHTGATTINGGTLLLTGTIGASSAITVNDGATLRLGQNDRWGGHATATSSAITLNAGSKLQTNGFFNTLVNPTLAGGAVELTGGANATFGALALKGTVTVSGSQASVISAVSGANNLVNLGPTDAAGAVTFDVADVTSSAAADLTVAAVLQNNRNAANTAWLANGLTKTGAGTLVLEAANTYTGLTTVAAGTLRLGASGSLAASTGLLVAAGATLDLNGRSQQVASLDGEGAVALGAGTLTVAGSGDSTFAGSLAGTGALVKSGSGSLVLASALAHTGGTVLTAGTLELAASDVLDDASALTLQGGTLNLGLNDDTVGALALSGGTVTGLGTLTAASIAVTNATGTVLVETGLASAGGLTKTGAGTLDIRSLLDLAGGLRVSEGIVTLANGGSLGAEDAVVIDGGSLDLGEGATAFGSLTLASGSLLGTGTLTAGSYTFSNTADLEVAVGLAGDGALTKTGAGTLVLSGDNTFSGGLTIDAGRVEVASLDALGLGAITLGEAGILSLNLVLSGDLDLSSALAGGFSGTGLVELAVSGASAVSFGAGSSFGGTVLLNSGLFDLGGFGGDIILAGGQLLNGGAFTGTTVITGAVTDLSQLPLGGTLILESGASIDFGDTPFSGAITYRGGSVSGSGFTGILNVEGTNVAISGSFGNGKLSIGAGNSIILDGATTGTLVFAGGSITGGANLAGRLELAPGGTLVIGQGLDVFGNDATLALGSGTLDLNGSSSQGTIAFTGGSLTGAASFAGLLAVSGGATLATDETVGGTVTLASGTTLAGNGTFTGTVTAGAGSALAPGSSPGLTTYTGTLNLTGGSVLKFEFFSTEEIIEGVGRGYDAIQAATLNFGTAGEVDGGKILLRLATLANWSDSISDWNTATGFTPVEGSSLIHILPGEAKEFVIARFGESDRLLTLADGQNVTAWFAFDTSLYLGTGATSFQVFAHGGDNNWELTLRVVPEPSTYGLILGALALAGAAVRRRKRVQKV